MISVVICTYNGKKYIREQLTSIIHQTRQPDEIVVCDDCSSDGTLDIVRSILNDWKGIKTIVGNEKNLGYKKNFEKAIGLSQGDIIFLSDQDDVWDTEKIQKAEAVFKQNPKAVMIFHDAMLVDENLHMLYPSFWSTMHFNPRKFSTGHSYTRLLEGNVVQGSACAFRRSVYTSAIPFCTEAVHDEWLALVASLIGELVPIPETLMQYRQAQNAVGGLPDTLQDKRRNYTCNKEKHFIAMINELNRRTCIMDTLIDRYHEILAMHDCTNYIGYRRFLNLRLNKISSGDIRLLLYFCSYITFSDTVFIAMKIYIKDFLLLLWNRKKS